MDENIKFETWQDVIDAYDAFTSKDLKDALRQFIKTASDKGIKVCDLTGEVGKLMRAYIEFRRKFGEISEDECYMSVERELMLRAGKMWVEEVKIIKPPEIDQRPIYTEDLNQMHCSEPGCGCNHHDDLALHSGCHTGSPTFAWYKEGILTIKCAICETVITKIAVASLANCN